MWWGCATADNQCSTAPSLATQRQWGQQQWQHQVVISLSGISNPFIFLPLSLSFLLSFPIPLPLFCSCSSYVFVQVPESSRQTQHILSCGKREGAGWSCSQQSCLCVTPKPADSHLLQHPRSHVGKENEMCLQLITLRSREQHSMWCWALINHPFNQISKQREMLSNWQ